MSRLGVIERPTTCGQRDVSPRQLFAGVTVVLAATAALLAGWAPLGFSVVIVFLFAGPHNWIELRYFLSRLPGRLGPLRSFFLLAFAGIFGLTAAFAALPWLGQTLEWEADHWLTATAVWNSVLLAWIVVLIQMRCRQRPRRDWGWTLPVAFGLLAVNWLAPTAWDLGLVYLHPLVALWILDRELRRSRPEWRPTYHRCLLLVPVLLGVIWWRLHDAPSLPGDDILSMRIAEHAGAGILKNVSSHCLVATHTFLEMLHYSVWVIAIPLVGLKTAPWRISMPLTWRSPSWRLALGCLLAVGVGVMLVLWACFLADYPTTRDVYFTVALAHVLAEVPFLLRAL